jgi:hypothetical protein
MSRSDVLFYLMVISLLNVVASAVLVVVNFVSPVSLRLNLSFLAVTSGFCAVNVAIFNGWF